MQQLYRPPSKAASRSKKIKTNNGVIFEFSDISLLPTTRAFLKDFRIDVRHLALLGTAINPDVIITPGFSSLFPLLPTDVPQLQLAAQMKVGSERKMHDYFNFNFKLSLVCPKQGVQKEIKTLADIEMHLLPQALQIQLRVSLYLLIKKQLMTRLSLPCLSVDFQVFVSLLSDFFAQLDVGEDCYAVGSMSKLIAAELASLPSAKARRKVGYADVLICGFAVIMVG